MKKSRTRVLAAISITLGACAFFANTARAVEPPLPLSPEPALAHVDVITIVRSNHISEKCIRHVDLSVDEACNERIALELGNGARILTWVINCDSGGFLPRLEEIRCKNIYTAVSDEELECVESVLKGVTHLLEVRQAIRDGRCIKFQPDAAAWKACDILLKIFPGLKGLPKALFDPRSEEKFYGMAVLDLLLGIEILKQAKDKKVTIDNYKSVAAWVNKEISNETKLKEEMLSEKVE